MTAEKETTEKRPWGEYTVLLDSTLCKIKTITVNPGQRLSLQLHYHRQEHWTMIQGEGVVTLGEKNVPFKTGESIIIPLETKHRIANTGTEPLVFVEIQRGTYFGEDDIVRFEDDYNRVLDKN